MIDLDLARRLYRESAGSVAYVAEQLAAPYATVRDALVRARIHTPRTSRPALRARVVAAYKRAGSIARAAEFLGVSRATVAYHLHAAGARVRKRNGFEKGG